MTSGRCFGQKSASAHYRPAPRWRRGRRVDRRLWPRLAYFCGRPAGITGSSGHLRRSLCAVTGGKSSGRMRTGGDRSAGRGLAASVADEAAAILWPPRSSASTVRSAGRTRTRLRLVLISAMAIASFFGLRNFNSFAVRTPAAPQQFGIFPADALDAHAIGGGHPVEHVFLGRADLQGDLEPLFRRLRRAQQAPGRADPIRFQDRGNIGADPLNVSDGVRHRVSAFSRNSSPQQCR